MSETTTPAVTTPATQEPQTFPREYVTELRRENETYRRLMQTHRTEAETAKATAEAATAKALADIEAATKEATTKAQATVTEANTKAEARVMRSELRAAATKAGMVDLDGLKMVDTSSLKFTPDGDLEGVDALIEATKKAKPYLFGTPSTSNTTTTVPNKDAPATDARKMTDAEFEAAFKNKSWRK